MKPTLQTVADVVGVSRSTVSNAYSRPDQPKRRSVVPGGTVDRRTTGSSGGSIAAAVST